MVRALVVDDDASIVKVLAEVCRGLGLDVITASDGVEALDKLRQLGAHIVLLDLAMPRLGGFGVLEELRREPLMPQPAVVVVTAKSDATGKIRCAELGAIDHIDKPFRISDVQRRIRRVVTVNTLERRLEEAEAAFHELRATDRDTGVGTFSQLSTVLDGEFRWAKARGAPLSCIVVSDERYGQEKDRNDDAERLHAVTQLVARAVSSSGRLFRVDAAELVVLLPGTAEASAREQIDAIVAALSEADSLDAKDFALACASFPHPELEQPNHLYRAVNTTLALARSGQGKRVRYFAGFLGEAAAFRPP